MKLDRLLDKQAKYESYLQKGIRCKVVPHGLNLQLEPTIGNHDQEFLDNWYQKLNKFSFELMGDIKEFQQQDNIIITNADKGGDKYIEEANRQRNLI